MKHFLLGALSGVLVATIVFRLHLQRLEARQSDLDVRITQVLHEAKLRIDACEAGR